MNHSGIILCDDILELIGNHFIHIQNTKIKRELLYELIWRVGGLEYPIPSLLSDPRRFEIEISPYYYRKIFLILKI